MEVDRISSTNLHDNQGLCGDFPDDWTSPNINEESILNMGTKLQEKGDVEKFNKLITQVRRKKCFE